MKMMIGVVDERFLSSLTDRLSEQNIRITKLHSTGGFLSKGNATLLLGMEEDQLDVVKEIFKDVVSPEEVHNEKGDFIVKGATLFVIDVEKGLKM